MLRLSVDALEGTTLNVYAYIVRADGPVGVREVTRGVELSSTSVTHRHLQKLETLDLIEKDNYGRYVLKTKVSVGGHMWVGKNLVPRLIVYSFFFIGVFIAEISIILFSLVAEGLVVDLRFLFFAGMTFVTIVLFVKEGLYLHRKLNLKHTDSNQAIKTKA
jgi:hypothetical protein